jgi:uncharacterized protein (TIGR01777 family)
VRSVLLFGGTGFIGNRLIPHLESEGWRVTSLKRGEQGWDGKSRGAWESNLDTADAVINLAGAPVTLTWTPKNRQLITGSRVNSTRVIAEALASRSSRPAGWLNASAVGYYGDRGDEVLHEPLPAGTGFLAEVCAAWEDALFQPVLDGVRRVAVRTGIVLGPGGGALEPLAKLAKIGLGGAAGSGRQWMPWIHIEDHVRMVAFALNHAIDGPMNAVGPNPATNSDFAAHLRRAVGVPIGLPAPAFGLDLVGRLGGPDPHIILDSTRAVPTVAVRSGFHFKFNDLSAALKDALRTG